MNLSQSIRLAKLTAEESSAIAESRAVLKQCGETLWALRPFDPAARDVAPCYDAWCNAGDQFRANPSLENAHAVTLARKAMDEAGANQRACREVLLPTIDSHHDRLGKIATGILDRVVAEVESSFEKRRATLAKQDSPTSAAEIGGLDTALASIRLAAQSQRQTLSQPSEGNPWLELHGF